jgi:acyl-coenzyme A thioesterase PaaI-like protein
MGKQSWIKNFVNPKVWKARMIRLGFNLHPAYRRTGGRVEYVSPDLTLIRVRLSLRRSTRNMVGSIFGGSLFAVTDGPHPLMLIMGLGREYIVWDKAASIQYKRPGRSTLYADFIITAEEIAEVREILTRQPEVDRVYRVELKDRGGVIHSVVERTVYIANKDHYEQKNNGAVSQ